MKKHFLLSVFFAILASNMLAQIPNSEDFRQNLTEDQKQKVEAVSKENSEDAFAKLCLKYQIPNQEVLKVRKLLSNCEKLKAIASIVYRDTVEKRVNAKMKIDEMYKDSIYEILIPCNSISGENLGFALNLCKRGLCKPEQEAILMKKALDIAHKLESWPGQNVWNEEMDILKKVLTKDQLNAFFELKNLDKNNQDYNNAWKQLEDGGLAEQLNKDTDGKELLMYIEEENKLRTLYKYRDDLRQENLNELYKHQPYAIRLLSGLNAKKNVEERKIGSEFIW